MRCQHCGKRLPILRKLTDSEFCSPEHRRAFQEEQERHALSRLLEASQMGRKPAPLPTAASLAEAKTPKSGKGQTPGREARKEKGPSTPPAVERFFPIRPEGTRPIAASTVPSLMEVTPELLLPDGLARRYSRRVLYRLREAPSARVPFGMAGKAATAATAPPRPLQTRPGGLLPRRVIAVRTNVKTGGPKALTVLARRSDLILAKPRRPDPLPARQLAIRTRPSGLKTDWVPPRRLESNRPADAAPLPPPTLRASTVEEIAWPAPAAIPAPVPVGLLPRALPGRVTAGPVFALPAARRQAALTLGRRTEEPRWLALSQERLPDADTALRLVAPPAARCVRGGERRVPGAWLRQLPSPKPVDVARQIAGPETEQVPFPAPAVTGPIRRHHDARSPAEVRGLVPLPERYRPESRRLADRGKTLFLTVMARTQRVELVPMLPGRRVRVDGDFIVPAPHECLTPLRDILAPAPSPPLTAPPVRVFRPALSIEMDNQPLVLAGGCPKPAKRLVRWIPTLSGGIPPTDLATSATDWRTQHLKPTPPRLVLRPEPARTRRQGLVSDTLRQLPLAFAKGPGLQRLWRVAPADLRWVAMALPVVIGLAWYSLAPNRRAAEEIPEPAGPVAANAAADTAAVPAKRTPIKSAAPSGSRAAQRRDSGRAAPAEPVRQEDPGFFASLREKISQRAAVEVSDDFRNGLSAWEGNPGWSDAWSYDQAGFVKPGSLALLTPTVHLRDYSFEFLGQIEHRALSWVYRARDTRNYYAGKLVVVQGGPLPKVNLVRYRVVNGREEGRKSIPVPEQVRQETMYRVRIDVSGNDFTTSVLGKVVDTFSDEVHPQGGIGFFAARGEESKIRWVELSHQYDTVGRLCAFLAPPRVPASSLGTGFSETRGSGEAPRKQ